MSLFQSLALRARLVRLVLTSAVLLAGVAIGAGAMAFAQDVENGTIQACVDRISGAVRIVEDTETCTRYETPLDWNLGGVDGLNCWDLDGDGEADAPEDVNRDSAFNALDCQGPPGQPGPPGPAVTSEAFTTRDVENSDLVVNNGTLIASLDVDFGAYLLLVDAEFVQQGDPFDEELSDDRQLVQCSLSSNERTSETWITAFPEIEGPFPGTATLSTHVTGLITGTVNLSCHVAGAASDTGNETDVFVAYASITAIPIVSSNLD